MFHKIRREEFHSDIGSIRLLLFFTLLLLQACSPGPKPTFKVVAENYFKNRPSFETIKRLACEVEPTFGIRLKSDTEDIVNKNLKEALEDISVSSISASFYDGNCKIALEYYAIVLGGNGISYSYTRNSEIGQPYDPAVHKFEDLDSSRYEEVKFYMQLADGWYFAFKSS